MTGVDTVTVGLRVGTDVMMVAGVTGGGWCSE